MANTIRIAVILVLALLAVGCGPSGRQKISEIPLTDSEQHKGELLARIEKDYGDAESHYRLGRIYHADGLWHKAESEFHVALGFDPVHWPSEAAIVRTLQDAGDKSRSRLAAEQAMNRAGFSAASSLLLGKGFQRELMDDYAVACYRQALDLAPNSAALNKQVGYYYLSKGKRDLAEEFLRRSFQIDPYQPEVAGELGRLGVVVKIPRKTTRTNTKKLDKLLEEPKKK
ncbi:MAG: hypothetical protein KAR47_20660 [Planctomycetes bacterium]|nr:hypothetical protein [Planctomycetota bacterium]